MSYKRTVTEGVNEFENTGDADGLLLPSPPWDTAVEVTYLCIDSGVPRNEGYNTIDSDENITMNYFGENITLTPGVENYECITEYI